MYNSDRCEEETEIKFESLCRLVRYDRGMRWRWRRKAQRGSASYRGKRVDSTLESEPILRDAVQLYRFPRLLRIFKWR